ncbi:MULTISPECIES: hypothetical protein [Streptomyces]|uniref:hypothetical protein n=1 Tax=Streptomyces TaxID=1883 RepID=UPI002055D927|nr:MULTISPECIES: hypothetical protein [Streptomyces]UPT41774.1 hypothetical protein MWG59_10235 [Streptomyces sp. WAC00303]WIY76006.1 hypothetical protein QPM16_10095 [Streptomyces anulatus]
MRVRMKVTVSGTRDGEPWPEKGGDVDLPDNEAKQLIAAGLAAEPDNEPEVEEATAPPAETSTPSGRKPAAKPTK